MKFNRELGLLALSKACIVVLIISARSFPDLSVAGVAHGLISFPRAKKLVPKQ